MEGPVLVVREAAERLEVSPVAVRQQIAAGQIPAVKRGRDWLVDERAVERMCRQPAGRGRPLSAPLAWAVLLLASGDSDAADQVAGRARYRSRSRAWLRDRPLRNHAPRLRERAVVEEFDAHPSELRRIVARSDVLATGSSAGDVIGLIGSASTVEVYAPASRRGAIVEGHALAPGTGPVRIAGPPTTSGRSFTAAATVAPLARPCCSICWRATSRVLGVKRRERWERRRSGALAADP
jgi:excisionase family DNA binding protein